jgi:iron complex transport system substrate-binding protein
MQTDDLNRPRRDGSSAAPRPPQPATTTPCPALLTLLLTVLLALPLGHAQAEIRLRDYSGNSVTLAQPARRIVSLAPHITESLFAIGAGDQIIATVSYSDFPAAAEAIPRIGSYNKVNAESLVAMAPDLVIAWASGNGMAIIDYLRSLGLTVFVSEPRELDGITASLREFAALSGRQQQGAEVADAFSRRLRQLQADYQHKAPVTVFYQVWNDPILSINDQHLIGAVIRLCGGVNVFADALSLVPKLNIESIMQADPQVIIASGMDEERPQWVDAWRQWPGLRAARLDHLYFIPPSLLQRHSTRILEGASQMCELLDRARASEDGAS